ncbi:MAG: MFS transporter [Ectothiorhodospiraceae bacterium]|nr:MFS transporter [Ectothiorhodospiraceae bacterium]
MSLAVALASTWALFLSLGLLMLGHGLQGTLLGLRAGIEGFSPATVGVVMTGYFGGYLIGSQLAPVLIRRVGHIRVFAALAAIGACVILLHPLAVDAAAWTALRVVTGICFAGLYLVVESWLNDAVTNETRGRLLSVYMVVMTGGLGAGQLLLNVADPAGLELFVVVALLITLSLVPVALVVVRAPTFASPSPVSWRRLYRSSPLGVVGAVMTGTAHSAIFGLAPTYGQQIGLDIEQVSLMMAGNFAGGMLLQWPIGWLSDRFDRRTVLTGTAALGAVAALGVLAAGSHPLAVVGAVSLLGGASLPLYSLCIAHTNDHLRREEIVAAGGTIVLLVGLGMSLGPSLAGSVMSLAGPAGLFWWQALAHGGIVAFALYRMTRRPALAAAVQGSPTAVSPRTTALATAIAMRMVRDHRDRDIARLGRR